MKNKDKILKIAEQQIEKIEKLSEGKQPLTSNDIRSLTELVKLLDDAEKLDRPNPEKSFDGLSPEELILIYEYRKKKTVK